MIRHLFKLVWNRKRTNALLVLEIFVSFLVIFTVLAFAVTFASSWKRPVGFDWRNVANVNLEFELVSDDADDGLRNSVMRMVDEARAMPQVASVAISNTPPYAFSTHENSREVDGRPVSLIVDDVSDDFAEVMRLKMVSGRFFSREDDASAYQPIVVDTNTARAIWGDADPVGQKLDDGDEGKAMQVVGVVEEYRKDGELSAPMNMMFVRISRDGTQGRLGSNLVVRLQPGTPVQFEEELVRRLQAVAPDLSFRVRPMDQMRDRALKMRLSPLIVGGVVALFLISMVALGLIGVLWQSVTKRTREIGLRRAMGATGGNVHRQILAEVVLLALIALIIGVIVVLQLPLLGVFSILTPAAFTIGLLAALVMILTLTVVCGLYPSWLASRLTPADALRYE